VIAATLRPERPADKDFLRNLITATIALELGAAAWPEPMRSHLLQVQYSARRHARLAAFPDAEPADSQGKYASYIIEADGVPAGWLVVAAMSCETRVVEIMVAPELRGKGIGSAALRQVLATAAGPVRLSVNIANGAAIRLYERLGFRKVEQDDLQFLMEHD
jgi:ribosomal protein S18 acetylase RimI-like enzyme